MRVLLRDLSPLTPYRIQVRAKDDNGNSSDWSRIFDLLTVGDAIAPLTPTGVTNTVSGTAFKFTWNAVTTSADGTPASDLKGYVVEVSSPIAGGSRQYETQDTKMDFSYENNVAVFGAATAQVRVAVAAIDTNGNISAFSTPAVLATNPAPTAVTGLSVQSQVDGINVKWSANTTDLDLKGYEVWVSTTGVGGTYTKAWAGAGTSYVHPSTLYGTDHFFKVYSVDVFSTLSTAATSSAVRPASSAGTDTVAPATPTGLAATLVTAADTTTSANVTWTAVTDTDGDLAGYRIGYRPVGASDWQYTDVDYTNTSTLIDRLTPYTEYEFRIRSYDFSFNMSAWAGTVTTNTAAVNTAPSTPSAPAVSSNTLQVQVTLDGLKAAGGAMEPDVAFYEVYASTTSGFTASAANMLGVISVGPTLSGTFYLPANGGGSTQNWYVRVIAVDRLGLKSAQSAQSTANPNLIANTNIVDATITNAKISSLGVDKLIAGNGVVNDFTVKAKLTLGDAATDGVIESYDYGTSAGATGFRLAKSGLIIKTGQIEAPALRLQTSPNMMPPQYADFEFAPSFYTGKMPSTHVGKTITTGNARFGQQYLQYRTTSASASEVYYAATTTDYNIAVEEGKTYIISSWLRPSAVTTSVLWAIKFNDTTGTTGGALTLTGGSTTWVRHSTTVTIPTGVTAMNVRTYTSTAAIGAGWDVDGVQVEEKVAGTNTPSSWSPPSFTQVDGGIIRTGEIRSNINVTVNGAPQPAWSVNTQGNAQFGDAVVRGKILVGPSGPDADAAQSYISSGNFSAGLAGWKIDSSGAAEFSNALIRGTITGSYMYGSTIATDASAASNRVILDGIQGLQVWQGEVINMILNPKMEGSASTSSQPGYSVTNGTMTIYSNPDVGYLPLKWAKINPTTPTSNVARLRYTTASLVLQPNKNYVFQARMYFYNPTSNANSVNNKYGVAIKRDEIRVIEGTTARVIALDDSYGWGGDGVFPNDYKYEHGWRKAAPVYTEPYRGDDDSTGYGPTFTFAFTTPADWNNQPVTLELPGNAYIRNDSTGAYTVASTARIAWSQLQLEQNLLASDYFDGSYTGYASWTGTADNSTSKRTAQMRSLIPVQDTGYFNLGGVDSITFKSKQPAVSTRLSAADNQLTIEATGDKESRIDLTSYEGTIDISTNRTRSVAYESGGLSSALLYNYVHDKAYTKQTSLYLIEDHLDLFTASQTDSSQAGLYAQLNTGGTPQVWMATTNTTGSTDRNVTLNNSGLQIDAYTVIDDSVHASSVYLMLQPNGGTKQPTFQINRVVGATQYTSHLYMRDLTTASALRTQYSVAGVVQGWYDLNNDGTFNTQKDVQVNGTSVGRGAASAWYAEITASSATTVSSGTPVDVPSLAVTFTAIAGRRYKVSVHAGVSTTVANDRALLYVREGTTNLTFYQGGQMVSASSTYTHDFSGVIEPTAGSHTYKVSFSRLSGTGTLTMTAAATGPSYILVEDIGLA